MELTCKLDTPIVTAASWLKFRILCGSSGKLHVKLRNEIRIDRGWLVNPTLFIDALAAEYHRVSRNFDRTKSIYRIQTFLSQISLQAVQPNSIHRFQCLFPSNVIPPSTPVFYNKRGAFQTFAIRIEYFIDITLSNESTSSTITQPILVCNWQPHIFTIESFLSQHSADLEIVDVNDNNDESEQIVSDNEVIVEECDLTQSASCIAKFASRSVVSEFVISDLYSLSLSASNEGISNRLGDMQLPSDDDDDEELLKSLKFYSSP